MPSREIPPLASHFMGGFLFMKILELYSGTQGVSNAFRKRGHEVLSVELNEDFTKPPWNLDQWTISVADVTVKEVIKRLGGYPDVIWASPLCTTNSIAAISTHRYAVEGHGRTQAIRKINNLLFPKSEKAKLHDQLLVDTLNLIQELRPKLYFIENPVGGMRKNPLMRGVMYRHTVTYCQYELNDKPRMERTRKPTDIWTNHPNPNFKPMCKNGADCHAPAPRGSKTGTQGKRGNLERSMIPKELCKYIVDICEKQL